MLILCLDDHETLCRPFWMVSFPSLSPAELGCPSPGISAPLSSGAVVGGAGRCLSLRIQRFPERPRRCQEGAGDGGIFLLHADSGPSGPLLVTFAESPLSGGRFIFSWRGRVKRGEKKTFTQPCKSHVLLANGSKLARLSSLEPCHLSHQRHFVRTSNMCTPDACKAERH